MEFVKNKFAIEVIFVINNFCKLLYVNSSIN